MVSSWHVWKCSNFYKTLEQKIDMVSALCTGRGNMHREQSEITSHLKSNTFCLSVFSKKTPLHYVKYSEGLG